MEVSLGKRVSEEPAITRNTSGIKKKLLGDLKEKFETSSEPKTSDLNSEGIDEAKELKKMKKTFQIVDGIAPVDEFVLNRDQYKVAKMFGKTYSTVLNRSCPLENKNKFYVLQMLEHKETKELFVFFRWGRIGVQGDSSLVPFGKDTGSAIAEYDGKLNDKAVNGHYVIIKLDFEDQIDPEEQEAELIANIKSSKVSPKVGELVKNLFSLKLLEKEVKEIGYDAKTVPFGKLSEMNLKMGYNLLKLILGEIDKKSPNWKSKVSTFSTKYYTFIPHDIGFKNMKTMVLDTKEKVQQELSLMSQISKLKVTQSLITKDNKEDRNTIDNHYKDLNTEIKALDKDSPDYEALTNFVEETGGEKNGQSLELLEAFSLNRENQVELGDQKGRKLLFFKEKLSSIPSLLSQGLKLPPHEAPLQAYPYGKGLYFCDTAAEATTNFVPSVSEDVGYLLACEVALGDQKILLEPSPNAQTTLGSSKSVHVRGRNKPISSLVHEKDGFEIPQGPVFLSGQNDSAYEFSTHIVYNINQVRPRYLLQVKQKTASKN